jgi:hypothetical protein
MGIIFSEEVIGGLPDKRCQLLSVIRGVLDPVSAIIRDGQFDLRQHADNAWKLYLRGILNK